MEKLNSDNLKSYIIRHWTIFGTTQTT